MTRLTRLEHEILYTLWLSELRGNKDGLTYKHAYEQTASRCRCTFESVKRTMQDLRIRREPYPPVVDWEVAESDSGVEKGHGGRRAKLWLLDPKHLVTLPVTAVILRKAHRWPHSCINENSFLASLNDDGVTDEMFLERRDFMLENKYLGATPTPQVLFYNTEDRTTAEIDYIRRIALHFYTPSTEALPEETDWPPKFKDGWPIDEEPDSPED